MKKKQNRNHGRNRLGAGLGTAGKVIMLLMLIAANTAKGAKAGAEEIEMEVLFPPERDGYGYHFSLDSTGNGLVDKEMLLTYSIPELLILSKYITQGAKIIYENEKVKGYLGEKINTEGIISIITENGRRIGLEQLLSENVIKVCFPFLHEKLKREGKVGAHG